MKTFSLKNIEATFDRMSYGFFKSVTKRPLIGIGRAGHAAKPPLAASLPVLMLQVVTCCWIRRPP